MDRYCALARLLAGNTALLAAQLGEEHDEAGVLMDVVGTPAIVIMLTNGHVRGNTAQQAVDVAGMLERAFGHGLAVPVTIVHITEDERSRELAERRAACPHAVRSHIPPEP